MQAGLLGVLANGNEGVAKSLAQLRSRAARHSRVVAEAAAPVSAVARTTRSDALAPAARGDALVPIGPVSGAAAPVPVAAQAAQSAASGIAPMSAAVAKGGGWRGPAVVAAVAGAMVGITAALVILWMHRSTQGVDAGATARSALDVITSFAILVASIVLVASVLALALALLIGLWRVTRRAWDPIPALAPPNPNTDRPLGELQDLAQRSALRLRSSYRMQLGLSVAVAVIIGAAFVWSVVMVTMRRLSYATLFSGGGLGASVLAVKWQPFDRVGRARDLAEQADVLATGLRLRMHTIAQIADPAERQEVEWTAVKDYTESALATRRADSADGVDRRAPGPSRRRRASDRRPGDRA